MVMAVEVEVALWCSDLRWMSCLPLLRSPVNSHTPIKIPNVIYENTRVKMGDNQDVKFQLSRSPIPLTSEFKVSEEKKGKAVIKYIKFSYENHNATRNPNQLLEFGSTMLYDQKLVFIVPKPELLSPDDEF